MNIKWVLQKYKGVILYLFFGGCTTVINVVVYWIIAHLMNFGVMFSTIIAWIAAVLFAYITNRKWVFGSISSGSNETLKEVASFFTCRLATGVLDWGCMLIFVDIMRLNDVVIKIVVNFIVIILNYVASKLVVFRKNKKVRSD